MKKRTTVYLDDKVLKLLKLRSIQTDQSVSDYINTLVYTDMLEEQKDLKDIKSIVNEPTVTYQKMLEELDLKDEV